MAGRQFKIWKCDFSYRRCYNGSHADGGNVTVMLGQLFCDTHQVTGVQLILQSKELFEVHDLDQGRALKVPLDDCCLLKHTDGRRHLTKL